MFKVLYAIVITVFMVPHYAQASNEQTTTATPTPTANNITAIDDVKRGSIVTVKGTVNRILDTDEFRLIDGTGSVRVYVGWQNFVSVKQGETVEVTGFVDRSLRLEIYAQEIVHADGRVTRLANRPE
jgi:uncharacterized protein YdeI (BOF family)